jgi:hypothetical protein
MVEVIEWNDDPELPPIKRDRSARFEHIATAEAHAYWRGLCRGRPFPARTDIDPVNMREFLTNVALVQFGRRSGDQMEFSIRLAGDHVESVFGPISGRALSESLRPQLQERWRHVFGLTIAEAAPLRFFGKVGFKTWLDAELLLAPLSGAQGSIEYLFAAFAAWRNRPEAG